MGNLDNKGNFSDDDYFGDSIELGNLSDLDNKVGLGDLGE